MFTGIIQEVGTVTACVEHGGSSRIDIAAGQTLDDLTVGGSIAVNGACLTATRIDQGTVGVDVVRETLRRTNLGSLGVGARVNLERPLAIGARLEGHWVQGHVDGIAALLERHPDGAGSERLEIELPATLATYVVEKGSIAVDGVSLTVGRVATDRFAVHLIPHTLAVTTFGGLEQGWRFNIEVDILAKYLERLTGFVPPGRGAPVSGGPDG